MRLFELVNNRVTPTPESLLIPEFKKIWDRDTTKDKDRALQELLFVYAYSDTRSDYNYIKDTTLREIEVIKDMGLGEWKPDESVMNACNYALAKKTIIEKLYEQGVKAAEDVGNYLGKAESLLNERNEKGAAVTTLPQITAGLKSLPAIMRDLKAAYKEVVKEQRDTEGKSKGSQTFNTFEDGLDYE
jgi:hypothetical protein